MFALRLLPAAALFGAALLAQIPHLEKRGSATQLIVDGKPFLALAGELENNASTSLEHMRPIWPRLRAMQLNTVLAAVSWAMVEPREGTFDFAVVDGLIHDARAHNLRLALLWFGSWKNTWSSYAPEWVKRDFERFPRVSLASGLASERLSPFSDSCRDADARAFAAFMKHLRESDHDHTVIMVQVENEVGVIPAARDHSPAAEAAYNAPVPAELIEYLSIRKETLVPELREQWRDHGYKTSGGWEAIFGAGPETGHLFMSWHYARYIDRVAAAGKAEYNLPLFTNAALIRPGYIAGQYNSGGPVGHALDVWKAGGPRIDLLSPDIYFEFPKWCAAFARPDNALFIPETSGGFQAAANVFYAVGRHGAIGFSPFAIESDVYPVEEVSALTRSYETLGQLAPLILEHQARGQVNGVVLGEMTPSQILRLGDFNLRVYPSGNRRLIPAGPVKPPLPAGLAPHGIFIAVSPDEFYIAGAGLEVAFTPDTPGLPQAGLATVQDGHFVDGKWTVCRTLAGDDTAQGNNLTIRNDGACNIQRVTLYRYR